MSSGRLIMVIEDDHKTAELVRLYLERDGHAVLVCHDGRAGLELVRQRKPELIVLDLMLPRLGGLDICRTLRTAAQQTPIIMLTARSTEDDLLLGLELGADDYIVKPFSPRELAARVRTVLRRAGESSVSNQQPLRYGDLVIDPVRHEARLGDQPLPFTPKEFKLLETLSREPGRAFTRLELVQRVFGFGYEGLERTVDAHIMNLRKKLAPEHLNSYIQTVYGIGYRFAWEPEQN